MTLSEADPRAKFMDPALRACGWIAVLIRWEKTAEAPEIIAGKPRGRANRRTDNTLGSKVNLDTQPVAVEHLPAAPARRAFAGER